MSDTEHTRWRDELAAHLLGSLSEDESAELEAHLKSCEPCRTELRWLRPAVETLADSVERLVPPAELRARLMSEVRADAAAEPVPARRPLSERLRGFMLRPATALAATAVIGAGVAGYVVAGDEGGQDRTVLMVPGPGDVSATLSREGDSGTLRLAGVEQPRGSQVHQAWVQRGTRVTASAQLQMRSDGTASARIPDLDGVDSVMVTLEDRPGREQPTTKPLAELELES